MTLEKYYKHLFEKIAKLTTERSMKRIYRVTQKMSVSVFELKSVPDVGFYFPPYVLELEF